MWENILILMKALRKLTECSAGNLSYLHFLWNVSKLTNCGLCQHLKWQMLNVSIRDFRWRWKIKFNPFQDNGLTCRTGVLRKAIMKRTKNMEKCSLLWFFVQIYLNWFSVRSTCWMNMNTAGLRMRLSLCNRWSNVISKPLKMKIK